MSLPNCLRRVSLCIWLSAAPPCFWSKSVPLLLRGVGDPPSISPLIDDCRLDSLKLALALLVTGESGISCPSGRAMKLVMASITSTRGGRALAEEGVMLGALLVKVTGSDRSWSRVQCDFEMSSDRWMAVYV